MARLLRVVDELAKLRKDRAAERAASKRRVGIVWSHCDHRVDDVELAEGEWLALDVTLGETVGEVDTWRTRERITRDPEDYGLVYDAAGDVVGRVAGRGAGGLVELELCGVKRA